MTTAAYDIGDLRRLSVAFKDINGAAADPTTVTFRMRKPDGTVTTYVFGTDSELVKDSVGNYHVDWTFALAGRHVWRFEGSAGGPVTTEEQDAYTRRKEAQ